MFVCSLSVTDFRCYHCADLAFDRELVFLCGANAQGKTNLLEAAFFALKGRSFRTHDPRSLIRRGAEAARARALVRVDGDLEVTYEAAFRTDGVRVHKRNGARIRRSDLHLTEAPVIPISADDSRIITDEPAARRDFLDSELSQMDPRYAIHLAGYRKALEQKSRLLRRGLDGEPIRREELSSWNTELAGRGAVLMSARRDLVTSLSEAANDVYGAISAEPEELAIGYAPATNCTGADDAIEERLFFALSEIADAEIASGRCLRGPHRDDLIFSIGGSSAKEHASRGQVRSAVLSLRIALMRMLEETKHEAPLVLFDDFDNDLDAGRRRRLLGLLEPAQQVIVAVHELRSCADTELKRAEVFSIEGGSVTSAPQDVCATG